MATKQEFLVAKDKMSVALATVSIIISSPGMALKYYACSVKGKGQIGPFFVFLGAISDWNAGFPQWRALAETLFIRAKNITRSDLDVILANSKFN